MASLISANMTEEDRQHNIFRRLMDDDFISAMRGDPTSAEHIQGRVKEIIAEALAAERDHVTSRMNGEVATLRTQLSGRDDVIRRLKADLASQQHAASEAEEEYMRRISELERSVEGKARLESELQKTLQLLDDGAAKSQEKLRAEQSLRGEVARLEEELKDKTVKLERLAVSYEEEKRRNLQQKHEYSSTEHAVSELQSALEAAKKKSKKLMERLQTQSDENKRLTANHTRLQSKYRELGEKVESLLDLEEKENRMTVNQLKQRVKEWKSRLGEEVRQHKKTQKSAKKMCDEYDGELKRKDDEIRRLKSRLDDSLRRTEELEHEVDNQRRTMSTMKRDHDIDVMQHAQEAEKRARMKYEQELEQLRYEKKQVLMDKDAQLQQTMYQQTFQQKLADMNKSLQEYAVLGTVPGGEWLSTRIRNLIDTKVADLTQNHITTEEHERRTQRKLRDLESKFVQESKALMAKYEAEATRKIHELKEVQNDLRHRLSAALEEAQVEKTRSTELKRRVSEAEESKTSLQKHIEESNQNLRRLHTLCEEEAAKRIEAETKLGQSNEQNHEIRLLSDKVERLESQNSELRERLRRTAESLPKEIEMARSEGKLAATTLEQETRDLRAQNAKLLSRVHELEYNAESLREEKGRYSHELTNVKRLESSASDEVKTLRQQLDETRRDLEEERSGRRKAVDAHRLTCHRIRGELEKKLSGVKGAMELVLSAYEVETERTQAMVTRALRDLESRVRQKLSSSELSLRRTKDDLEVAVEDGKAKDHIIQSKISIERQYQRRTADFQAVLDVLEAQFSVPGQVLAGLMSEDSEAVIPNLSLLSSHLHNEAGLPLKRLSEENAVLQEDLEKRTKELEEMRQLVHTETDGMRKRCEREYNKVVEDLRKQLVSVKEQYMEDMRKKEEACVSRLKDAEAEHENEMRRTKRAFEMKLEDEATQLRSAVLKTEEFRSDAQSREREFKETTAELKRQLDDKERELWRVKKDLEDREDETRHLQRILDNRDASYRREEERATSRERELSDLHTLLEQSFSNVREDDLQLSSRLDEETKQLVRRSKTKSNKAR